MTLLNNENNLLPLSRSLRSIAVIGPNANVARYGDYEPKPTACASAFSTEFGRLLPGAAVTFTDGKDIAAAVAKATNAEVVILCAGRVAGNLRRRLRSLDPRSARQSGAAA